MSVDYTIAAIPTLYRGRQYRSRLEARWAAFFDLLGWQHEYEPFDLGKWSPDFLLPEWDVLVEVKPLDTFDQGIWDKAISACEARNILTDTDERDELGGIFLTRLSPETDAPSGVVRVGWFGVRNTEYRPMPAYLCWVLEPCRPVIKPTIVCLEHDGWYSIDGDAAPWLSEERRYHDDPISYSRHTMELWAKATNTVQWLGRGATP